MKAARTPLAWHPTPSSVTPRKTSSGPHPPQLFPPVIPAPGVCCRHPALEQRASRTHCKTCPFWPVLTAPARPWAWPRGLRQSVPPMPGEAVAV